MQRAEAARAEEFESALESIGNESAALNRVRELEEQLAHANREVDEAHEHIKQLERAGDADQIEALQHQLAQTGAKVDEVTKRNSALQADHDATRESLAATDAEIDDPRDRLDSAAEASNPAAMSRKEEASIDILKTAFTSWIDSTLLERGVKVDDDLFEALADGYVLYDLVEVLSGDSLTSYGRLRSGTMKLFRLANLSITFNYLATVIKITNTSPADVLDMVPKRVLGG